MNEKTASDGELRLVNRDPAVSRSASAPGLYNVKFTFEGRDPGELANALEPRLAAIGVESVHRFGMSLSFYGVKQGREAEVYAALEAALAEVSASRAAARAAVEREREASDAAQTASETQLEQVREGFHAARSV